MCVEAQLCYDTMRRAENVFSIFCRRCLSAEGVARIISFLVLVLGAAEQKSCSRSPEIDRSMMCETCVCVTCTGGWGWGSMEALEKLLLLDWLLCAQRGLDFFARAPDGRCMCSEEIQCMSHCLGRHARRLWKSFWAAGFTAEGGQLTLHTQCSFFSGHTATCGTPKATCESFKQELIGLLSLPVKTNEPEVAPSRSLHEVNISKHYESVGCVGQIAGPKQAAGRHVEDPVWQRHQVEIDHGRWYPELPACHSNPRLLECVAQSFLPLPPPPQNRI